MAGSLGPSGILSINQEEMIAFVADRLGVPQKVLNTPAQKAEQMLLAQQQMETMAQQAPTEAAPEPPAA